AAFSRRSAIASAAQSTAVTLPPRAAATSDGTPRPQPSSTTRTPSSRSGSSCASARPAGQSSAQYGMNSSSANASSSSSDSGSSGRAGVGSSSPIRIVSEEVLKADRDAGRQLLELREREQHSGDERVARGRVVADRQRLAGSAEDHLLVGNKAGQ